MDCAGNISVTNLNTSVQTNITTNPFGDGRFNFTFNFTNGSYSLVDCKNFSSTVIVGRIKQGYGTSAFFFILPAALLSFLFLFISARMNKGLRNHEEENRDNGIDKRESRTIPTVFMLFGWIPMIFMIRFTSSHLEEYVADAKITSFFGTFYILFLSLFSFVFIISFVLLASKLIKWRSANRGMEGGM
ncbi:hypothetical protein LCGC14_2650290 [marine sediment metagenome]|uniref:Uncharacterized protein n=1 Tax=marine sediment metagenome TaxID=412755 RepID=A0A0F8ZUZ1_9ZZZZ